MSRLAIFRADASPDLGAGHVVRCSALAEALGDAGWETALACREPTLASAAGTAARFDRVIALDGAEADEAECLRKAHPDGCALLVVDHYGRDAFFETACRPWAKRILALDDLADRPHDCDDLLDQTPGRDGRAYDDRLPAGARRMVGPQWALLRPAFGVARLAGGSRRRGVQRALVTPGATDRANLASRVVGALSSLGLPIAVDVMLAGSAPFLDAVRAQAATAPIAVEVHVDVGDPIPLMQAADLAVGAAGSTALERCCLGLPSLMVVTADNQRAVAGGVEAAGAGVLLGDAARVTEDDIAGAFGALAGDADRLERMAQAAALLCDGLGARRVASLIGADVRANDGVPVTLRPATAGDADIMEVWQRHPQTRHFARTRTSPSTEEHRAWLARRIADPACLLNIIMHGDVPSGVLRLDRRPDDTLEVSVFVAPERYRNGLGRGALALARALVPHAALVAQVLPENQASRALFERAGYRPLAHDWYRSDPAERAPLTAADG